MFYALVFDNQEKALMPTTIFRAKKWIKEGKATPFYKRGFFCIRLNFKPSGRKLQKIVGACDPGSKKEGFTIKSKAHTYFNIQSDAIGWVKDAKKTQAEMRRARRSRNTPYRKCRSNRSKTKGFIPPSSKARWDAKLRIMKHLSKLLPIDTWVVEDVNAKTRKGGKNWNTHFSVVQDGKNYFYNEIRKFAKLKLKTGIQTFNLRQKYGVYKSPRKLDNDFHAHCVDSWVMADSCFNPKTKDRKTRKVDNKSMRYITFLQFHRRQLHMLQFAKGGIRKRYGGTMSLGLKRGSLVKHIKHGLSYVGGHSENRISLHSVETGKRLTQNAKVDDCKFLCYNSWRWKTERSHSF